MVVGDLSTFAIDSSIEQAIESRSFVALGSFVIVIDRVEFGVRRSDATYLSRLYGEVLERIRDRGQHTFGNAANRGAFEIAVAFNNTYYFDGANEIVPDPGLIDSIPLFCSNRLVWSPGDAAFDDGSFILHFDVEDLVRLVGFKQDLDGKVDRLTIREKWLSADVFYDILNEWAFRFMEERTIRLESDRHNKGSF